MDRYCFVIELKLFVMFNDIGLGNVCVFAYEDLDRSLCAFEFVLFKKKYKSTWS